MTDSALKFMFDIGRQYETQAGELVTVLSRTTLRGYECLVCSDGKHRYDRSDTHSDAGRVTGTPHDYSHPDNFKRLAALRAAAAIGKGVQTPLTP